jgi:hypothetical protein
MASAVRPPQEDTVGLIPRRRLVGTLAKG